MMNRRGQTPVSNAGFEPMVSVSKRSRPTPRTMWPLGPILTVHRHIVFGISEQSLISQLMHVLPES
jgi:hypothetical protein